MAHLEIRLFGTFEVARDGAPATGFATDKARALLVYLAVASDRVHRRDALANLLWPDDPQSRARHSLRQALSCVRRAIMDDTDAHADTDVGGLLLITRETVRFNPASDAWIDVAAFTAHQAAIQRHRHRAIGACRACLQRLEAMLDLYRGDFLRGFSVGDSAAFEEWVMLQREWYHLHTIEALTILARYYERRGDLASACACLRRQVTMEPWREEAHRQLMRLLAADEQRSAALKQYHICRTSLRAELDVAPTAETTALFEAIRTREPEHFALAASSWRGAAFPTRLGPRALIGRARELAELNDLLANPDCRLITLVGPGGIGKSCLAWEAAHQQRGLFAHGIALAPLAAVRSPALLPSALADALAISGGRAEIETQLLNHLRSRTMLLVLDNFEQVAAGAALLTNILREAPDVVLLVTSRARINLRDEWVYPVDGLPYLAADAAMDLENAPEAMQLFLQRATQAGARWPVRLGDAAGAPVRAAVARICHLVAGMPLALELAAAQSATRPVAEIAADLTGALDVLASRLRDAPDRHRSIRATFEHSWELLAPAEQAAFRALAVFRGGFTPAAGQQVSGASRAMLQRLVEASLLHYEDGARTEHPGRYRLHPLLRQYAAEKLAQHPQTAAKLAERHAMLYADLVAQCGARLKGAEQSQALAEMTPEVDNIRRAWAWARAATAYDMAARMAEGLYQFWAIKGWYEEAEQHFAAMIAAMEADEAATDVSDAARRRLLGELLAWQGKACEYRAVDRAQALYERSLRLLPTATPEAADRARALALHGLGYVAHMHGDYARARRCFQESLALYRAAEDVHGGASALMMLSLVARREGAYEEARQFCEESLALRRKLQDARGLASTLNGLGLILCASGGYDGARAAFEEVLAISRRLDYKVGLANAYNGLCQVAFHRGDVAEAERFARAGLRVYQDIGDRWGAAIASNNVGYIALQSGDYATAQAMFQAGIALYREMGVQSGLANTLNNLGQACYGRGEFEAAERYLEEALRIAREIGARPIMLEILLWLARLEARAGDRRGAMEALALVRAHPATLQSTRESAAAAFDELAHGLSPAQRAEIEAQGQALSLAEIAARS